MDCATCTPEQEAKDELASFAEWLLVDRIGGGLLDQDAVPVELRVVEFMQWRSNLLERNLAVNADAGHEELGNLTGQIQALPSSPVPVDNPLLGPSR